MRINFLLCGLFMLTTGASAQSPLSSGQTQRLPCAKAIATLAYVFSNRGASLLTFASMPTTHCMQWRRKRARASWSSLTFARTERGRWAQVQP